jgi:hypothetical protein
MPDEHHVVNTFVDVLAVFAAHRLLKSGVAHAARARLMTRVSSLTMPGLGAFLRWHGGRHKPFNVRLHG